MVKWLGFAFVYNAVLGLHYFYDGWSVINIRLPASASFNILWIAAGNMFVV